jgi:hypothetical protein
MVSADPPPGKGKGGGNDGNSALDVSTSIGASVSATIGAGVSVGITIGDARRLATSYELTGAKPLPPGIAKTRLPDPFIAELPYHQGYEWQRIGRDLVLVAVGTLIVAEILEHVFD